MDTTEERPKRAWARFRGARWYWQTAGWLFVAPVILVFYTLSKPAGERRRWWVATVAAFLVYGLIGASSGSSTNPKTTNASSTGVVSTTTGVEAAAHSVKSAASSRTKRPHKATTTTAAPTTTVPTTTTTTPPSINGTGKITVARLSAFDICKQFVSQRLKAPSGAKWRDPIGDQVSYYGDNKDPIRVEASVDSENSFGAKLRSTYQCTVTNTSSDNWHLDDLQLQDGGDLSG
jgi:hypothetical protein